MRRHKDLFLTVRWVPGHEGIKGNEAVDQEAKRVAQHRGDSTPAIRLPAELCKPLPHSKTAISHTFHGRLQRRADKIWAKSPRYPRIKAVDPTFTPKSYRKLTAKLPKKHIALLMQLRTGHIPLNRHLFNIHRVDSPLCPCCRRFDETVAHFLLFCPAHEHARRIMHNAIGRDAGNLKKIINTPDYLRHLFRFVASTGCLRAMFGEIPELPDRQGAR